MNREAWAYALAFVAIIAAGAAFIVPRLQGPPEAHEVEDPLAELLREGGEEPVEVAEGPAPIEGETPEYAWVAVTVAAEQGALRGPLRDVHGGQIELLDDGADGVIRLRVRPLAERLYFGAVGHRWRSLRASELDAEMRIELAAATKPIVVRVREVDGTPAEGVPVRVLPAVPGERLVTDAGGTVVLDHLAPGLVVVDLGSAERAGPVLRLLAGSDTEADATLDPAWAVVGRLLDPQGKPVAGAQVRGFGPQAIGAPVVTGTRGQFTWRGPAVARLALRVHAPGWAPRHVEARPPVAGPLRTDVGDVRLEARAFSLQGQVDLPYLVDDARVEIEPEVAAVVRELYGPGYVLDEPREAALTREGRFELDDLTPNLPLRVRVRGAGVPLDHIVVEAPGTEAQLVLAPRAGHALHGQVLRADGEPAVGLAVYVSAQQRDGDRMLADDRRMLTGGGGRFLLRGLAEDVVYLRAYAAGHRSLLKRVRLPLEAPLALRLEPALLDAGRRVTGTIIGQEGTGLPGVTVRAAGVESLTDDEGAFVLDGVESLAPRIDLYYGYEPGSHVPELGRVQRRALPRIESVVPGGEPLRLLLPTPGGLRLRAVDGVSEAPLSFVHVFATTGSEARVVIDRGFALRDGVLRLPDLPPGGLALWLFAPGLRWSGTPQVRRGEVRDLGELSLVRGLRIEGVVRDEAGQPLGGVRVGAFDQGWQSLGADRAYERELLFRTARTSADGTFAVEGFARRRPEQVRSFREAVDLAFWAPGHAPTCERIDLAAPDGGRTLECAITLEAGSFLSVDLEEDTDDIRARGAPVHGAVLDAELVSDGSDFLDLLHWGMLQGTVASSEDWRFASQQLLFEARSEDGYLLGPMRQGAYEIYINRPGFTPLHRKLTLVPTGYLLYRDPTSSLGKAYEGRVTHFVFALSRHGR